MAYCTCRSQSRGFWRRIWHSGCRASPKSPHRCSWAGWRGRGRDCPVFLEVFDPLQGIAVRRLDPGGIGLHQGEAEQGQQTHVAAAQARLFRDAVEVAVGELIVESQQFVHPLRRIGIDRVGAVLQVGFVFGDLALGDLFVPFRSLGVMQRITQGAAVQVGVGEVGVEFDGPGVVALGAFEIAQAGFEHGTQVIDLDIAGGVERHAVEVVECAVVIADLGAENRPVEIGERVGRVQLEYPVEIREGLHRTVGVGIDHRPVEIGRQESRVAADRHVEIGFGSGILLFCSNKVPRW